MLQTPASGIPQFVSAILSVPSPMQHLHGMRFCGSIVSCIFLLDASRHSSRGQDKELAPADVVQVLYSALSVLPYYFFLASFSRSFLSFLEILSLVSGVGGFGMMPACPKSRPTVEEGWAPTDNQYLGRSVHSPIITICISKCNWKAQTIAEVWSLKISVAHSTQDGLTLFCLY